MTPRVFVASGVAVAAVGLGLALGLGSSGGSKLVGPLRTFGFAAALAVALTHLLPEALGVLGAPALLLFAAASVAPAWGRFARALGGQRSAAGGHGSAVLGAGYAGLVVHHVGDGLGLGAYSKLPGGPVAHADVLLALAVHTVPLVAVVTLAFRSQRGVRAAVERAAGLAAASVGGVALSSSVPSALAESLSAWIAAGVAGLLLHVVTHDLGRDLPATNVARVVDAAAAIAGVATTALGSDPELVALRHAVLRELGAVLPSAAPALVAGIAVAVWLGRTEVPWLTRWLRPLPGAAKGLDGAFVGAALGGARFGVLFWLGTALTARLSARTATDPHENTHADPLGRGGSRGHPTHGVVPAFGDAAALVPARALSDADSAHAAHADSTRADSTHADSTRGDSTHAAPADSTRADSTHGARAPGAHAPPHAVTLPPSATGVAALVREAAPWFVTGLVLYVLLVAALRPGALALLPTPVALAGAAFTGLALELPAAVATLVAVGLWQRGAGGEVALAFALMAEARKRFDGRALLVALLVGIGVGSGNAAARLEPPHLPAALGEACSALVALGLVFSAWRHGARGLFASVFHSHDSA